MKTKIVGTLGKAGKAKVEGFGVLNVTADLRARQQAQPTEITKDCTNEDWDFSFGEEETSEDAKPTLWAYAGFLVEVAGVFQSDEERALLVRETVWKREKRFAGLKQMADFADFADKGERAGHEESKDKDAVAALRKLGYTRGTAEEAVRQTRAALPEDASLADVVKLALKTTNA